MEYYKSNSNSDNTNYIKHFGVRGMKWGVRRTPAQLGHKSSSGVKQGLFRAKTKEELIATRTKYIAKRDKLQRKMDLNSEDYHNEKTNQAILKVKLKKKKRNGSDTSKIESKLKDAKDSLDEINASQLKLRGKIDDYDRRINKINDTVKRMNDVALSSSPKNKNQNGKGFTDRLKDDLAYKMNKLSLGKKVADNINSMENVRIKRPKDLGREQRDYNKYIDINNKIISKKLRSEIKNVKEKKLPKDEEKLAIDTLKQAAERRKDDVIAYTKMHLPDRLKNESIAWDDEDAYYNNLNNYDEY